MSWEIENLQKKIEKRIGISCSLESSLMRSRVMGKWLIYKNEEDKFIYIKRRTNIYVWGTGFIYLNNNYDRYMSLCVLINKHIIIVFLYCLFIFFNIRNHRFHDREEKLSCKEFHNSWESFIERSLGVRKKYYCISNLSPRWIRSRFRLYHHIWKFADHVEQFFHYFTIFPCLGSRCENDQLECETFARNVYSRNTTKSIYREFQKELWAKLFFQYSKNSQNFLFQFFLRLSRLCNVTTKFVSSKNKIRSVCDFLKMKKFRFCW